jgi:hypothetical protein
MREGGEKRMRRAQRNEGMDGQKDETKDRKREREREGEK